jgi:hypothetical protein
VDRSSLSIKAVPVEITDLPIAVLRAVLANDFDTHDRLIERLDRTRSEAYGLLLAAAFFEAVDRRFAKGYTRSDIIQLVASVRARFEQSGRDLDPCVAERLMLSVLEDVPGIEDLDHDTVVPIQVVFSAALIHDAQLDDVGLEQFLSVVQEIAETWAVDGAHAE